MLIMNMIMIFIIVTVGKRFRVHYHNGKFTGYVTWYNSTMKKMRVPYEDGTDEYFAEDDIDGVKIIDY